MRYELTCLGIAILIAAAVFYVDTFTDIHSALATLYVIPLLLSAETLTERGMLLLAALCICLAAFSYSAAHGLDPDLAAALRLAVAIAALLITTALIIRNQRARLDLLRFNTALLSSEARYRTIFEQSRVALWERDYSGVQDLFVSLKARGVVDLRNHARQTPDFIAQCIALIPTVAANAAALELLGNVSPENAGSMRRYLAPDDATFLDLMVAIFEGDRHFEGKGTVLVADGTTKQVLLTFGFPENVANFNRVVVGMIDITEREMAQKALFEAQAELALAARAATVGALSASLAHELNQPLGALVVNAQTLQRWLNREPPDLEAAARSAERMVRDSRRASDIIQNTRAMLASQAPMWEKVTLPDLVADTRALMENELARSATAFELTAAPDLPTVTAVRIELQQVLINLMTNAIQAMGCVSTAGRRLDVAIAPGLDGTVVIGVRDTGPGMSEGVMAELFKPFRSSKETGLGMGLAICRSMMEAHGGRLTASNHADGGALFEMIIPIEGRND